MSMRRRWARGLTPDPDPRPRQERLPLSLSVSRRNTYNAIPNIGTLAKGLATIGDILASHSRVRYHYHGHGNSPRSKTWEVAMHELHFSISPCIGVHPRRVLRCFPNHPTPLPASDVRARRVVRGRRSGILRRSLAGGGVPAKVRGEGRGGRPGKIPGRPRPGADRRGASRAYGVCRPGGIVLGDHVRRAGDVRGPAPCASRRREEAAHSVRLSLNPPSRTTRPRRYRFANEPASDTDAVDGEDRPPRQSYGGKLAVKFRADGYTDALAPPSVTEANSSRPRFEKIWGWDRETSAEDALDYLLFSADVSLPAPVAASERLYFQARVEGGGGPSGGGGLALEDGSITVKRNVESPAGGWWGIFRGAEGILAQFREVGTFRCRPIPEPPQ